MLVIANAFVVTFGFCIPSTSCSSLPPHYFIPLTCSITRFAKTSMRKEGASTWQRQHEQGAKPIKYQSGPDQQYDGLSQHACNISGESSVLLVWSEVHAPEIRNAPSSRSLVLLTSDCLEVFLRMPIHLGVAPNNGSQETAWEHRSRELQTGASLPLFPKPPLSSLSQALATTACGLC